MLIYQHSLLVYPVQTGVILNNSISRFSTLWFVPCERELFSTFAWNSDIFFSLSPVQGSYSTIPVSVREQASLSPSRGSYSDQIKELTTVTKFVPAQGSYSDRRALIPGFEMFVLCTGSYSLGSLQIRNLVDSLSPHRELF